jgi:hypothetical protein
MSTKSKPWYKHRRYWSLAILAALVYFCLIPSPLRVSPETTGITSPLLPNGDVDYFGFYEQTYIHKLSPPEDNGQRLMIAALGPRVLEQTAIANDVPWENWQTDERSKHWFHEMWIPLCEHMSIDPYAKPRFLDNLDFYTFLLKEWEANGKEGHPHHADDVLREKLAAAPWTAEEYPNIARWLKDREPVLDLFGVAVRKPNYVCWRWRTEDLVSILLPDVQSTRQFGRELQVRITERLGRGDVDGAWHDVMSMFYMSRKHYVHDVIIVTNLVGIAIEGMGWESAKVVLQHGNLTPEQLERFAQDLNSLPRRMTLYSELERIFCHSLLQHLDGVEILGVEYSEKREPITDMVSFFLYLFGGESHARVLPRYMTLLPIDRNIAGKRIFEFLHTERDKSGDSAWNVNGLLMKKHFDELDERIRETDRQLQSPWKVFRIPLIRTRSQMVAEHLVVFSTPAAGHAEDALIFANTRVDLLRMAVALERYRLANEKYPESLDALVPQFLEEVPLEPFTGRKSFVYKVAPDAETAALLHSSEWDAESKDSRKKDLYIRFAQ